MNILPFCIRSGSCLLDNTGIVDLIALTALTDGKTWGQLILPLTYNDVAGRVKIELDMYSDFSLDGHMYVSLGQNLLSDSGFVNNGGARYIIQESCKCYHEVQGGCGNNFTISPLKNNWNKIIFYIDVPNRYWKMSTNGVIRCGFYTALQPNSVTTPESKIYIAAKGGIYKIRDIRVSSSF